MYFQVSYLLFQIIISIVTVLTIFYILFNNFKNFNLPIIHPIFTILIKLFVILFIAIFPITISVDKKVYASVFNHISDVTIIKDIGWYYYTYLSNIILKSEHLFFLLTSFLYISGYYLFFKSLIKRKYLFYILLTTFGSLGFLAYGVNTIRAGFALSILLFAFSKRKNKLLLLLLIAVSFSIHKSIGIIILSLAITNYIKDSIIYIIIWLLALGFSSLNINLISSISNVFSSYDTRVSEYMTNEINELYLSAGFRIDFIIYSLFPILFGYYYIFVLKFKDTIYKRLFNVYVLINAFWLLIIRIPFADRFAYLSWFLFSFLLLYPLLTNYHIKNKRIKLAFNILFVIGINLILLLKKHL